MNKIALILDVAHGINVLGKRSPDGKFKEWKWSRDFCREIFRPLALGDYYFDTFCPYLDENNEPGLKTRVSYYEKLAENYDRTIMLSIHVDAFGNGSKWYNNITGFSFWTSRGETPADKIATFIGESFQKKYLRDERMRYAYWMNKGENIKDLDWESNFTILVSNKYDGILIENLFQTNYDDVYNKLLNDTWNKILIDLYHSTIIDLMQMVKIDKL